MAYRVPPRPHQRILQFNGSDIHGQICSIEIDMDTGYASGRFPFGGRAVIEKTDYTQDEIEEIDSAQKELYTSLMEEFHGRAADE